MIVFDPRGRPWTFSHSTTMELGQFSIIRETETIVMAPSLIGSKLIVAHRGIAHFLVNIDVTNGFYITNIVYFFLA